MDTQAGFENNILLCKKFACQLSKEERTQLLQIVNENYPNAKEQLSDFAEVLDRGNGHFTILTQQGKILAFFYTKLLEDRHVKFCFVNVKRDLQGGGIGTLLIAEMARSKEKLFAHGDVVIGKKVGPHYVTAGCHIVGITKYEAGKVVAFALLANTGLEQRFKSRSWSCEKLKALLQEQQNQTTKSLVQTDEPFIARLYEDKESVAQDTEFLTDNGYRGTQYIIREDSSIILCFEKI